MIDDGEIGDACEQHDEDADDRRERPLRVVHGRLAKRGHPVADGFDAGHRRAAARERAHQNPPPRRRRRRQRGGRCDSRRRMAVRQPRLDQADRDDHEQAQDEQVGRRDEHDAGLAHTAQVHQRDEREDAETQQQGVRLESRDRGNQRADARRDPDRDDEHVVQQQRRRGQEPGQLPQVVARDRVGSAAGRIRADRLSVRQVDDQQQDDDDRADGADVAEARRTERNQQRHRRFRPVRR